MLKKHGLYAIIALVITVGLGYYAQLKFKAVYPHFVTCLVNPSKYDGKIIYTGPDKVVSHTENGFVIEDREQFRIDVYSKSLPTIGKYVELRGRFNKDHIECLEFVQIDNWAQKRFIMFLASVFAIVIFLSRFLQRFRFEFKWITRIKNGLHK